jgi:hypothetical protein
MSASPERWVSRSRIVIFRPCNVGEKGTHQIIRLDTSLIHKPHDGGRGELH